MNRQGGDRPVSTSTLSRRTALQLGALSVLASREASGLEADVETAWVSERIWERSVDTDLDPRVAIFDEVGVAVAFSDLLAVEEGNLYAFDVETGDRLWERPIVDPPSARFHDGVVYVHDQSRLTALDPRSGSERWSIRGQFGQPSVYDGEYAVFASELGGATVVDLTDGAVAWKPESWTMTQPLALENGQLILRGTGEIAAYDVRTGDQSWRLDDLPTGAFEVDQTVRTTWPYCFVTSGDPAVTVALDLAQGTVRWERPTVTYPRYFDGGAGDEGVILAANGGTVSRLGATTGEELWSRSLTENQLFLYLVDETLAVPVAEDHVWAVSTEDGSVEWEASLDTPLPIVRESNDVFYVADTGIRSFDRAGEQLSTSDLVDDESLMPTVSDTHVVATAGRSVHGFAIETETTGTSTTTRTSEKPTESSTTTRTSETTARTTTKRVDPDDEVSTTDTPVPGFGAVPAILGILVVIVEALRRSDDTEE